MRDTDSPKPHPDGLDLFISAVEEEFKRLHPRASFEKIRENLSSRCMDRWLILDHSEKKFFSKKNLPFKDSIRMRAKKRKVKKDPDQPRRALTAYLYFCKEERRRLSQNGSTLPLTEVTKEIANRWKEVSPEQRQHFDRLAAVDKQRYQDEMRAFRNRRSSTLDEDTLSLIRQAKSDNQDFNDGHMLEL